MSNEQSATAVELPFQSGTDALGAAPEDSSALERAGSARAMILEKPSRSGGCLHAYEPLDTLFSSTPDGYEPFYISHFGRHGSRYAGSKDDFSVIDELMKYSSRNSISAAESRKVTLSETWENEAEPLRRCRLSGKRIRRNDEEVSLHTSYSSAR